VSEDLPFRIAVALGALLFLPVMIYHRVRSQSTREPLDPVRFISNASTGAQGAALAEEALRRGHAVDLVHGPLEVAIVPGAAEHPVMTAAQMLERCLALHASADAVIGAAAVSDFRPREALESKQRREGDGWRLDLVPTEDILAALGKQKGSRIHVGFALETESFLENAARKLRSKCLDWIVVNSPEAIGGSRQRLMRQMITETAVLAVAGGLVGDLRRVRGWTALHRGAARATALVFRLGLWRQRHHIQLSRRAPDRRSDRGKNLAIAARLRHRSRRRQDQLKHGCSLKNGYGNGPPWARDVGLPNEVH